MLLAAGCLLVPCSRSVAGAQALDTSPCPATVAEASPRGRDPVPGLPVAGLPADSASSARGASALSAPRGQPVDIAIYASASANEVRFARPPEIRVRLCGGLDSIRVVERRNLPTPVVAGRTYRDVYVAVEILGRIDAACLTRRLGVGPDARDTPALAAALRPDCASITIGGAAAPPDSAAPRNDSPPGTDSAPARRTPAPSRP